MYAVDDAGVELWSRTLESHPVAGASAADGGQVFLDSGGPTAFDAASGDLNRCAERDARDGVRGSMLMALDTTRATRGGNRRSRVRSRSR